MSRQTVGTKLLHVAERFLGWGSGEESHTKRKGRGCPSSPLGVEIKDLDLI